MKRKSQKARGSSVLPGQLDLFAEVRPGEISTDMTDSAQENISTLVAVSPATVRVAPRAPAGIEEASKPRIKGDKFKFTRRKEDETLLDTREAARLLKLGVSTLEKMRGQKKGPRFLKLTNSTVRYKAADLEAWLEARARSLQAD